MLNSLEVEGEGSSGRMGGWYSARPGLLISRRDQSGYQVSGWIENVKNTALINFPFDCSPSVFLIISNFNNVIYSSVFF